MDENLASRLCNHIVELQMEEESIHSAINRTVYAARDAGASWSAIGHALGISKQAAQQKYGATPSLNDL